MKTDLYNKKITGLMFAYSLICEKKLWYYANEISMEDNNEQVAIGRLIDEESYKREHKHILINDCVNIDFMKNGVIYEIKKSKKLTEMSRYQIKFYLYQLYKNEVRNPIGILKIPKEKYEEEVYLTKEDIMFIEKKLLDIERIISSKKAPTNENNKICNKCAYYELCKI